jgi:hypothetical protein
MIGSPMVFPLSGSCSREEQPREHVKSSKGRNRVKLKRDVYEKRELINLEERPLGRGCPLRWLDGGSPDPRRDSSPRPLET